MNSEFNFKPEDTGKSSKKSLPAYNNLKQQLQNLRMQNQQNNATRFLSKRGQPQLNKFISFDEIKRIHDNLKSKKLTKLERVEVSKKFNGALANQNKYKLTNLEKYNLGKYLTYTNKEGLKLRKKMEKINNQEFIKKYHLNNEHFTKKFHRLSRIPATGNTFKNRNEELLLIKILKNKNENPKYLNTTRKRGSFWGNLLTTLAPGL